MKKIYSVRLILTLSLSLAVLGTFSCRKADTSPFTVMILPDTQNYSEKYPDTYMEQTRWIAGNMEAENTRFVIHLGDIVQNSDIESEWQVADKAHKVFDEAQPPVPYSVVPGNHDVVHKGDKTFWDTDLYEKYLE